MEGPPQSLGQHTMAAAARAWLIISALTYNVYFHNNSSQLVLDTSS